MKKILVIQGAGMDQRGRTLVEVFGPETLQDIDARITTAAAELNFDVEIFQSNDETEVVNYLTAAKAKGTYDALLINPGGFTATEGALPDAIKDFGVPGYEIHASNPTSRGIRSVIQPVCKGAICGFGYAGYRMAMAALKDQL